ncbi:Rab family GTPase [Pelomyxa schiedti]|nr:Rab family GTPase [Pelomyxa schiedti]
MGRGHTGDDNQPHEYNIRIILLGESGVGKSALAARYANDTFDYTSTASTIGVDYFTKKLTVCGKRLQLQIWDSAGQERFRCITRSYYHSSQGALLVYDVTDLRSFFKIQAWIEELRLYAPQNIRFCIVGNKIDRGDRIVTSSDALAMAQNANVEYFEASAKRDIGVGEAFLYLARDIVEHLSPEELDKCRPEYARLASKAAHSTLTVRQVVGTTPDNDTKKRRKNTPAPHKHSLSTCCT